ncbi:phosphotransferase [Agromyces allii]|uniref:Aminoglycoside phosphotransferase domain-containing protein n=1 Tax=Agromyces allii TaxID=393607 RepID=A0ABP5BN19_9MICO|nr:phosphotransferase [Agromyces allii]
MGDGRSREVELVLCLPSGEVLGTSPRFSADQPWTMLAQEVVVAARASLGLEAIVLRLLEVVRRPDGEPDLVRYLAEVDAVPPIRLTDAGASVAASEPLRMAWAEPGGPTRALRWSVHELAGQGVALTGPAQQVRTWNLSSVWRLPTDRGDVWLKQVPPFFAHEGAIIERLGRQGRHGRHAVPHVIARAVDRVLLADIRGEDLYDGSTAEQQRAMIDLLIGIQLDEAGSLDDLLALGLPDWRMPALAAPGAHALEATADRLDRAQRAAVASLVDGLDVRAARIAACGLPDTLVHGDFAPGNVRGRGLHLTLLDWGDSGVGHPLLDAAAFTDRVDAEHAELARRHWTEAWEAAVPGSDPGRAAMLLAPVAALRQAVIYQGFLDRIEPDERVYHRDDPEVWLGRAARLFDGEAA